jgi:hypothetical protein
MGRDVVSSKCYRKQLNARSMGESRRLDGGAHSPESIHDISATVMQTRNPARGGTAAVYCHAKVRPIALQEPGVLNAARDLVGNEVKKSEADAARMNPIQIILGGGGFADFDSFVGVQKPVGSGRPDQLGSRMESPV